MQQLTEAILPDPDDIARFSAAVTDWGRCYADWAGGQFVHVSDSDIVGRTLYPDGGDWVVYDARGRSGFIGAHHDNWSDIHPVQVKSARKLGIDLRQKKIARAVPTEELMRRYVWIASVFMSWLHVDGGSPMSHWATAAAIQEAFEHEAESFADDPHLALYWLMHFGLSQDPRYFRVAEAAKAHKHDQILDKTRLALAFFDGTPVDYDIDLTPRYNPNGEDFSDLFLRRRANLLYLVHSQSYRGDGPKDLLWRSVSLYRRHDPLAIRRMRWLRNNLQKFDLWGAMHDRIDDPANDDVPYINYVRAIDAKAADRAGSADALVREITETRAIWRNESSEWAREILWEIRNLIQDKKSFKAATEIAFEGELAHPRMADILSAMGEKDTATPENKAALADFEAIFTGLDGLTLEPQDRINSRLARSDTLLSGLSTDGLAFLVAAVKHRDAARVLLRFVLLNAGPEQEDNLVHLFRRCCIADHEFGAFFGGDAPDLIGGPADPVFRAFQRVMALPPQAYVNSAAENMSPKSFCALVLPAAHRHGIFDNLIAMIEADGATNAHHLIIGHVFRWKYRGRHNPVSMLDRGQVNRLLDACLADLRRHPDSSLETLRTISSCKNPLATDWIKATLADRSLFRELAKHAGRFDPLSEELKEELEYLLEELAEA